MRTALSVVFTLCPPGPGGTEDVHSDVLVLDLHVHLLRLGQDGHSRGGRVNAALSLGSGHALYPMDARLPPQQTVGPLAPDGDDGLLEPAQRAFAKRERLPAQPVPLRESLVHAIEVGGEEGRLVTAGAGPDLHDGITSVVRVLGQEQLVQLLTDGFDLGSGASQGPPSRGRRAPDPTRRRARGPAPARARGARAGRPDARRARAACARARGL